MNKKIFFLTPLFILSLLSNQTFGETKPLINVEMPEFIFALKKIILPMCALVATTEDMGGPTLPLISHTYTKVIVFYSLFGSSVLVAGDWFTFVLYVLSQNTIDIRSSRLYKIYNILRCIVEMPIVTCLTFHALNRLYDHSTLQKKAVVCGASYIWLNNYQDNAIIALNDLSSLTDYIKQRITPEIKNSHHTSIEAITQA